ncbi:hypothetical protein [Mycoplasma suis]|uniref:Uncharacterized protein n=2 Tax=Mycoplasma suis TaxID=57372 RepID=F0QQN7_MYCSL|nr:hypothetical protein [Mycoplasma suis]ADX97807.1 hypothetical protein MSU_0263 [Mycoplasma suis str. Illinois]CBZ40306.1 putative transcriptional regulator [Mycoplasma suis KI3806]
MLGSKILLFLSGGTVTAGTLGVEINFLLGGGNKDQLNKKVEKVDFRTRTNKSKDSLASSVAPFGSLEVEKVTKEIDEDDLDWEYILYYGQDQKKCESSVEKSCNTKWLKERESKWNKKNPKSTTELLIRRKRGFTYARTKSEESQEENPIRWIDYFLDEFKEEKITLDFDAADCNEIKKDPEDNKWQEWGCHLAIHKIN